METERSDRMRAGRRGAEPESQRAAPARAGAALCSQCAGGCRRLATGLAVQPHS
jgi:hypothetical protein